MVLKVVITGGPPTLMLTGADMLLTPSDTVSRAWYTPHVVYVWVGLAPVDTAPSPKSHE